MEVIGDAALLVHGAPALRHALHLDVRTGPAALGGEGAAAEHDRHLFACALSASLAYDAKQQQNVPRPAPWMCLCTRVRMHAPRARLANAPRLRQVRGDSWACRAHHLMRSERCYSLKPMEAH